MTSPEPPTEPTYADRVYRSAGGIMGGGLLLVIVLWLGGDALFRGTGRTPWLALAGLLFTVPLIIAFTLRPAVFASDDQLRIRNPFRLITLPWAAVSTVRAQFSCEALTEDGRKFQLWAVPVSLRQRKRANRRGGAGDPRGAESGSRTADQPRLAEADRTVAELRDLAERSADRPGAQGEPVVRWAYEVMAPSAAGLVVLIVLLLTTG
ncbi:MULTISPECIES: PH domain-containing protein [unclassified Streptomyces]|uniref:PH domain-containing protein n=1 Tax=unclassified Streptomyces TaxID=2593676 RepID=UPI002E2CAFAD|nr:PH domain-containing protein [Streptomyces sp. NBC_01429]